MRFCSSCGKKVSSDHSFCSNCGNDLGKFSDVQFNVSNDNKIENNKDKTFATDSKVLDNKFEKKNIYLIISIASFLIVACSFSYYLPIILSFIVLCFSLKDSNKNIKSIITAFLSIITVIMSLIYLFDSSSLIEGTWNCYNYGSSNGDYKITLKLNADDSFIYGDYGDLSNNHMGGTYTYKVEKEKTGKDIKGYKYFILKLNGSNDDYIVDGLSMNKTLSSEFEIAIKKSFGSREAFLINKGSYNTYYCEAK